MRSQSRDQGGMTTFGAAIIDAASGSGVAFGVPFIFTRTATGTYRFDFDTRLRPTSVVGASDNANRVVTVTAMAVGTFTAVRSIGSTAATENGSLHFTCTALDKRT